LGLHEKAISDCNSAISYNPQYSKAYARLGLANFSLSKYKEAADAYQKALTLEPGSESLKESLAATQKKLREISNDSPSPNTNNRTTPTPPRTPPRTPNLTDIFSNPDLMNMMSGFMGGNLPTDQSTSGRVPPNFSELLNNPALRDMAQQMMNNPQMMSMAQNLMQNPEALNNMMNAFGMNNQEQNQ